MISAVDAPKINKFGEESSLSLSQKNTVYILDSINHFPTPLTEKNKDDRLYLIIKTKSRAEAKQTVCVQVLQYFTIGRCC